MRSRLRQIAAALAVPALALVLALLLAETVVRVLGWPPRSKRMVRIANTKGMDVKPGTVALLCYPSNPRGAFQIDLRDPATRAHYEGIGMRRLEETVPETPWAVEMRYNSGVFRGDELPPRRSGVRRVIVIGDSFNQGWGVPEPEMFTHRLEELLNQGKPAPSVEVLNCARHDADFPRLWNLFERALALGPDVIVYGLTLNDALRSQEMKERLSETSPLIMVRGGSLVSAEQPGFFESRLLAVVREKTRAREVEQDMVSWYLDLHGGANRAGWRGTKGYIKAMSERMASRGGQFVLMTWPLLVGLEGDYPFTPVHQAIAEFASHAGIVSLDLLPVLRGRRSSDLWVHPVDRHPNEVAQRLVAESLAPVLRGSVPKQP